MGRPFPNPKDPGNDCINSKLTTKETTNKHSQPFNLTKTWSSLQSPT